jgi:hypothetical protein
MSLVDLYVTPSELSEPGDADTGGFTPARLAAVE